MMAYKHKIDSARWPVPIAYRGPISETSCDGQLTSMGDFSLVDRPHLVGFQSHYGGGAAVERHEFDFVGLAITINVDHRADIASFQPFGGHGRLEHYSIMFANHRVLSVILWVSRD